MVSLLFSILAVIALILMILALLIFFGDLVRYCWRSWRQQKARERNAYTDYETDE